MGLLWLLIAMRGYRIGLVMQAALMLQETINGENKVRLAA